MDNVYFPYSEKEAKEKGIAYRSSINGQAEFPRRLRTLRTAKGETLAVAAQSIGITRSTLGLYEKGDNVPDVKVIVRIAQHYGTTVNYLLGEDECPTFSTNYIHAKTGLSEEAISVLLRETPSNSDALYASGWVLSALIESDYFLKIIKNLIQAINYTDEEMARRSFSDRNPNFENRDGSFDSEKQYINKDELERFLTGELEGIGSIRKYELFMRALKHEAMDLYGDFFTMCIENKIAYCKKKLEKWQV